jgi:uncharacterized membrane protein
MAESPDEQHQVKSATLPVVDRNIRALLERRRAEDAEKTFWEKAAADITAFAGSSFSVALHVVVFGLWLLINKARLGPVPVFDPSLVGLAAFASIEAIFLSTFILMTQQRMMREADRRVHLTLQVSLLAEYEITRLVSLTKEIADKVGVKRSEASDLEEIGREITPESMLAQIDEYEKRASGKTPRDRD